jgi:hypothetical protein
MGPGVPAMSFDSGEYACAQDKNRYAFAQDLASVTGT